VTVVKRKFDTHAAQWNFGLEHVKTPWVLSLDADYEVSDALAVEIQNLEPTEKMQGYFASFRYLVFGRPLRASLYPDRVVLFRAGSSNRYVNEGHTQRLKLESGVGKLRGLINHDDRKSLGHWIQAQDRYAIIEAVHLLSLANIRLSLQDRIRLKLFYAPLIMPFYLLFGRGLIFDGWPGWFYVLQRTLAEALLSMRLLVARYALEENDPT